MLAQKLYKPKCFFLFYSEATQPRVGQVGKSSTACDDDSRIKIVTWTVAKRILVEACYSMYYVAVNSRCGFFGFSVATESHQYDYSYSAMLLLSGSGVFQVWHMQKVIYYRNCNRRAQLSEKTWDKCYQQLYLQQSDAFF